MRPIHHAILFSSLLIISISTSPTHIVAATVSSKQDIARRCAAMRRMRLEPSATFATETYACDKASAKGPAPSVVAASFDPLKVDGIKAGHPMMNVTKGAEAMGSFGVLNTAIEVIAPAGTNTNEGFERKISMRDVELSAGTFGDPSRFMQMLPGVVSDNDKFNDFIVRGGNPAETLFVIDNIEIPSINQLALSDTTGGFVSMIDNAAIQQMILHTDAYDSKYDQRLSSVVEISTRREGETQTHVESEAGLAGAGGSISRPWGQNGSMFISGRQSILHFLTNDIGLNGVPIYRNSLLRADKRVDERNNWWGLSLTGIDSIVIHPSPTDSWETNPYDIAYKGWRNTSGINWQHIFSNRSFGVTTFSNSEQSQSVLENAQMLKDARVYSENTSDSITTLKYDGTLQAKPWLTLTAGMRTSVDRLNYGVEQPLGLQNPYNESAAPADAMSFNRKFAAFSSAEYSQAAFLLPRGMKLVAGQRLSQWAIVGSRIWTPKVLFTAPVFGMMTHVGYAEYAQLPPSLYILSFSNQETLKPIRSRHITGGLNIVDTSRARVSIEAYQKNYLNYPVAVNYPQLSLANIADTFGQAFLMFPMTSQGAGLSRGVELSFDYKPASRLTLSSAITYSRSWYSGLDGVLRRGNFDLPVVANIAGNMRAGRGFQLSFRFSGASGKPYTPDNLPLSLAQNRDVYDLAKVNGMRAAVYRRLDFRLEESHVLSKGIFTWHIGLNNALGTSNFYSNEWRPRAGNNGVLAQDQMPRFPDGGVKYSFGGH